MHGMKKRFFDLNAYYRDLFGCRVQKISIDAGLTCPNRDGTVGTGGCIYCNEKGSGSGGRRKGLSIRDQLESGMRFLGKRYKAEKFIAYFQSFSNTYAPVERLEKLYQEALSFTEIVGLSIGTRPDCISEPVLSLLESYVPDYLLWVEYGLQSANDKTLSLINRGHDLDCFAKAVSATKNRGIKICAHVILGLPGENRRDMIQTAKTLADLGVDGVKIHLLYVVKNTPLDTLYQKEAYTCLEDYEYADRVCDFLERLPGDMVIQRIASDPHPDELTAPEWSLDKNRTRRLIHERLAARDTWQGKMVKTAHAFL